MERVARVPSWLCPELCDLEELHTLSELSVFASWDLAHVGGAG